MSAKGVLRWLAERGIAPRALAAEAAAAVAFLVVPGVLFAGPLGPHRAPGLEGAGLYGQLFAGSAIGRWITGASPVGAADVCGDASWWPVAPAGALLQALLPADPGFALGIVVALGMWLAGYGPWRLARRVVPDAPVWGALLAGLAAQTSPVVLRAIPDVAVAALAVGPIALGLAHPRLALLGGLWSVPGAVVFALAGLVGRRPAWLLAGLPALALLAPASPMPAAVRPVPDGAPTVPAYVARGGAVFPLPPDEQAVVEAAARVTRTGLWLPPDVEPQVYGSLFTHPPGGVGGGRAGTAPGGARGPGALSPDGTVPGGGAAGFGPGSDGGAAASGASASGAGAPAVAGVPAPGGVPNEIGAPTGAGAPAAPGATGDREAKPLGPGTGGHWIGGALVPLQRLHGGPAVAVGVLALLLVGARGGRRGGAAAGAERAGGGPVHARVLALAGLVGLVAVTGVFGWQLVPGESERGATATARLLLWLDAHAIAGLPGGGPLAWAALLPAAGAVGLATLSGATRAPLLLRVLLVALLTGSGIPLENPRLVAPVTSLPPDPIRDALARLDPDRVVVFPAPQAPYRQGQRPAVALFWEAAETGQRVEVVGEDAAAAGLLGALTALTGVPVDAAAAERLWRAHTDDPLRAARAAGWRYLLVELDTLPPLARPRLDGWLAERAGMPVARDGARLLYDLASGPAGAGPIPGGTMPPSGGPGGTMVPGGGMTPGGMPGGGVPAATPGGGTSDPGATRR